MSVQRVAYKYRAQPNTQQRLLLAKTFGSCRFLYNKYVELNNANYAQWLANGKPKGQSFTIPIELTFKTDNTFLKEVDSLALMNVRRHFEQAMKAFYDSCTGKRKGKKVQAPKFHKKGVAKDSYTSSLVGTNIRLDGKRLKLPKVGWLKIILHRELPQDGRILSVTVTREKDYTYYVSILVERDVTLPHKRALSKPLDTQRVVGLDMSMSDFYVSSDKGHDATRTKYVRQYRKAEKRLKRLNRRHSRKRLVDTGKTVYSKRWSKDIKVKEPSRNRDKARLRLARAHRKVANRRVDFICQEAARLSKSYDVIVVEDLNMQGMSRSLHLGKSVGDLGWGMFINRLAWACQKNGCLLVKADKWYASSKRCNDCGYEYKELTLSEREWVCPQCGCIHDRDVNAALNLRDWYITHYYNTVGTTGMYACGDSASTRGGDTAGELSR